MTRQIVWVDEEYDRDYSSDGGSRFGAYVRQWAQLFVDDWEPLSPVTFAATVWSIASGPIMSPPYVQVCPTVASVHCRHGEEPGLLLAEVEVRLPWPNELRSQVPGWASWRQDSLYAYESPVLTHPADDCRALLLGAKLMVPIAESALPTPCRFAAFDVRVAKQAVREVCAHINAETGAVVELLRRTGAAGAVR